jgi:hypothetical protein
MDQEPDPKVKAMWELHLNMELEHLRIACDLMRRHDGREPEEVLAPELPNVLTFEPNKTYVRELLDTQIDLTTLGSGYVREAHERFEETQQQLNDSDRPPSERVMEQHQDMLWPRIPAGDRRRAPRRVPADPRLTRPTDQEDSVTEPAHSQAMGGDDDVVALLMRQHGDIRNLFDEVERSAGDERRDAFRRLVRLLAVHETAEEEVVHLTARRAFDGGEAVVGDRLEEERQAREKLARLDEMDIGDPEFLPLLLTLRTEVMEHARAEERYEFAQLRRRTDPQWLAMMAKAVKAAEMVAPTRPHPSVQTAAENIALGPIAAVVDRTRDAVRRTMGPGTE